MQFPKGEKNFPLENGENRQGFIFYWIAPKKVARKKAIFPYRG